MDTIVGRLHKKNKLKLKQKLVAKVQELRQVAEGRRKEQAEQVLDRLQGDGNQRNQDNMFILKRLKFRMRTKNRRRGSR